MSKEKQIEEMADDIRRIRESYFGQADYLFAICGQRKIFLCEMNADDMRKCYPYCPNCGAKMKGGAE